MQAGNLVLFLKGNKTYSGSWNLERNGHQTNEDHENKGATYTIFFPVGCAVIEVPVVYGFAPAIQKAFLHSHQVIFFILLIFVNL
jgi:hypothetical protein